MKTKFVTFIALTLVALTGCSTYQGGTADDYTYSYDNLYGLGPNGPQNLPPRGDIYAPATIDPMPWTHGVRP